MDYLVTFDDGSEGYLSHHGVKGQEWGVLSPDNAKEYAKYGRQAGGKKGTAAAKHKSTKVVGIADAIAAGKKKKKRKKSLGKNNKRGTSTLTKKGMKMYADANKTHEALRKARLAREHLIQRSH